MKAAPVDVVSGKLLADRFRIPTPHPGDPEAMGEVVAGLVAHFNWSGPVGCAFPGVVQHNTVRTAANLDPSWVGVNGADLFAKAIDQDRSLVNLVNDADAAGIAEMKFGAGAGHPGSVLMVTLGTGIGTAFFADGHLVPNTEIGHLIVGGEDAEESASARARETAGHSLGEWAPAVDRFLLEVHRLLWPDLIVVGGGVSKRFHGFSEYLTVPTEVVPAKLQNDAGIVGAALAAVATV